MPFPSSCSKKNSYFYLTLIVLLGFALRVYGLGDVAISNDESTEYHRWVSASFEKIMVADVVLNTPALALIQSRASILVLGDSLFSLRWPALCLSVLGIVFIYKIAQYFFGRQVGQISALLLAVSPYAVFYAHAFRGYSGVLSLALFVFLLAMLTFRTNKWGYGIAFGLVSAAAMYTHLFTSFAIVNSVFLLGLRGGWGQQSRPSGRRGWVRLIVGLAITAMILVIVYWPVWQKVMQNVEAGNAFLAGVVWAQRPDSAASLWTNLRWYNGLERGSFGQYSVYPFLGLVVIGVGLGLAARKRFAVLILLAWTVLPFLQLGVLTQIIPNLWARPHYLGYTLPPLLILIAWAVVKAAGYRQFAKTWLPVSLGVVFLVPLAVFWFLTLREFYQNEANGNWQLAANWLRHNSTKNDLIVCQRYWHPWRDADFEAEDDCTRTLNYWRKAGLPVAAEIVTGYGLVYQLLPQLNAGMASREGRVWVLVWDVPEEANLEKLDGWGTEFNRFGRSFLLLTEQQPAYLGNLAQALSLIRATTVLPDQQFTYSLMIAPLAAATHQSDAVEDALKVAAKNRPNHQDSSAKLQSTEQLVKALSLPDIEHTLTANFSEKIMLKGYNINPATAVMPGTPVSLTLFWSVLKHIPDDYSVFLHMRNQAGHTVAQFDYQPFGGSYPTRLWQPGQFFSDVQQFSAPPDLPPGPYDLLIGFYNPQSLARLPLSNDSSDENALLLTTLIIQ